MNDLKHRFAKTQNPNFHGKYCSYASRIWLSFIRKCERPLGRRGRLSGARTSAITPKGVRDRINSLGTGPETLGPSAPLAGPRGLGIAAIDRYWDPGLGPIIAGVGPELSLIRGGYDCNACHENWGLRVWQIGVLDHS